ncbi:pentatricopeptide repeat-containing protein At5g46100-like [Chenopodium quinoa]|uniref:pentatricopeptide repeat-containing protein At5g46100-like n=1 Tax=Chenopodium quinoa TaxID=63459 RepID=UPI000B791BB5|nr:pentatricopeptide repeat-containing protein At5g46100-like [Chenopodium quinoa]XP_021765984.1 pentatricopeptide repeat-containing protein At5g46100-like [Chenopodium quinoa]XP_021765985.1 pentatricopeptide repeat-containing protein At5g46100-like [Chenopodium quinoa]
MGTKAALKWSKKITTSQVEQLIRAEKDLSKAIAIFDSATAEYKNGFKHDHTTFGRMISRLVSANQFRRAEELLDKMKEEKCQVNEDIVLSICRGYGRVHKPLEAVRIFKNVKGYECELTEKSYITIFSILVDENHLKLAMSFYRYMKKKGIPPSVVSLNILIKALCKSSETIGAAINIFREMPHRQCPPDSYTYGSLISGLCKCGRIDEANELFREMETKGCLPSVVTYTTLMHGLCKSEKLGDALTLFEEMRSKDIKPNVFTYSALMDGLCKHGRSLHALDLLDMMLHQHLSPNMITYSTLIPGLCKDGNLCEAVKLFDRMKLQGLKPDAALYAKIITGFSDLSRFREAANFLDEMVLAGISPNRLTWSTHVRTHAVVIQGLCVVDLNRAFHVYLSMRTRGLSVEPEVFSSLIKGFCKKGDLHNVCRILDEMVCDGCLPDEEIWKTILRGFLNQRKMLESIKSFHMLFVQNFDELEKLSLDQNTYEI